MPNTIFTYKNPNPPTIEPEPDPNKTRYLLAVIKEEKMHEPKRFVLVHNEIEQEPERLCVLVRQEE